VDCITNDTFLPKRHQHLLEHFPWDHVDRLGTNPACGGPSIKNMVSSPVYIVDATKEKLQ
jgi:hypothetical protein